MQNLIGIIHPKPLRVVDSQDINDVILIQKNSMELVRKIQSREYHPPFLLITHWQPRQKSADKTCDSNNYFANKPPTAA